jgi:hypothetical protein
VLLSLGGGPKKELRLSTVTCLACLAALLLLFSLSPPACYAAGCGVSSGFIVGEKQYYINGLSYETDMAPYLKNGKAYVPLRHLAYILDLNDSHIRWQGRTIILVKDDITVEIIPGEQKFTVNGAERTLGAASDTAPPLWRVMLPATAVAEAFGAQVSWQKETNTLSIVPRRPQQPPATTSSNRGFT